MLQHLRPALVLLSLFTVLTGLAYPLAVTGLAQRLFPHQAHGSLVVRDGQTIGSELIGQQFGSDRYFHGRPSATSDVDPADPGQTLAAPYNAAASGGSNLGPTSKALIERIRVDAETLQAENPGQPVPVDLVTASASGLDPDISIAAAQFQIPRIARVRGIGAARLQALVEAGTTLRLLGLIGEPVVRVLALNQALDALSIDTAAGPASH